MSGLRSRILIAGLAQMIGDLAKRPVKLEDIKPYIAELLDVYAEAVSPALTSSPVQAREASRPSRPAPRTRPPAPAQKSRKSKTHRAIRSRAHVGVMNGPASVEYAV